MKNTLRFLLFAAALHSLQAANTGALKGYVKDQTGAIVQGAALTLLSVETGVTSKVKADDNGFFQFLQLAPGRYELNAAAAGFRRADVNGALLGQSVADFVDRNFFNCRSPGQCSMEGRP